MFHAVRVLFIELMLSWAWLSARIGIAMLPKDHPLRKYHEYSENVVRPVYRQAAQRLR